MFFIVSKLTGFLAYPSNWIFLLAMAGVAMMATRFARAGRVCAIAAVLLLGLFGYSPLGNWLIAPLERRFPPWSGGGNDPTGIIVLGGAISPDVSAAHGAPALNEAAERVTAIADLARRFPKARIVYSGGNASLVPGGSEEAPFALGLFESFGIARERILLESRARNTAENALFTKALAAPQAGERWLLVTSAAHMPRAVGVFRQAGFAVEAYPVDWRTLGPSDLSPFFTKLSDGLGRSDAALHEWIGLAAYRITGKTAEFFPRPARLTRR